MVGTLLVLAGFAVLVGAIPLPTPGGTAAPPPNTASDTLNASVEPESGGEAQASEGENDAAALEMAAEMEVGEEPLEELGGVDSGELDDSDAATPSDDAEAWDEAEELDTAAVDLEAADVCEAEEECDLFAACDAGDEWCEE
jgi:hypothetical protein